MIKITYNDTIFVSEKFMNKHKVYLFMYILFSKAQN
jgi:hypothetical protein